MTLLSLEENLLSGSLPSSWAGLTQASRALCSKSNCTSLTRCLSHAGVVATVTPSPLYLPENPYPPVPAPPTPLMLSLAHSFDSAKFAAAAGALSNNSLFGTLPPSGGSLKASSLMHAAFGKSLCPSFHQLQINTSLSFVAVQGVRPRTACLPTPWRCDRYLLCMFWAA